MVRVRDSALVLLEIVGLKRRERVVRSEVFAVNGHVCFFCSCGVNTGLKKGKSSKFERART